MCYTKVVTKEKGNCSVTDKRYNIYKEDIKMAVVKLTTDNFVAGSDPGAAAGTC